MTDRASTDLRLTLAPAVLATLSGTLVLADRALDGPVQLVARIVLLAAVLAATAWCGSRFGHAKRSVNDGQD